MKDSLIASLVLLLVPALTVVAFSRLPPARAVFVIMVGGCLFLPERARFEVPLAPPLDKSSIPILCTLVGVIVKARDKIAAARPGRGIDLFLIALLLGDVGTVVTNADPLQYGPTNLPGLGRSDLISYWIRSTLRVILPYLFGRLMFRSGADALTLLSGLVLYAVIYTPFVLVELRMSPQWHNWIYGFFQHSFEQTRRDGGWRPQVFMHHGLALAMFMMVSALGAWALAKRKVRVVSFLPPGAVAAGLSLLVAMMNSLGALVYALVSVPIAWFAKPKAQARFAALVALAIAAYPILRSNGMFPAQALVDLAARQSQDRALSLAFRFANEDAFIDKAQERPLFGWGGWARGHVWNDRGENESVLDGGWLEMFQWGWVEIVVQFSLLLLPIWMALRNIDRVAKPDQPLLAGCALLSVFYTLDLLPNGIYNELPMFFAGALAGLAQGMPHSSSTPSLAEYLRTLRVRQS
jgi:hypothetical protein